MTTTPDATTIPGATGLTAGSRDLERPIRVLLVDDDPMVIRGLKMMLEAGSGGDIAVVASAADGMGAVPAVQSHFPDVVLMDIRMPGKDGIAATRDVMALPHPPAVVVLTTFDGEDEPVRAARAGAAGFLLKTESPEDIVAAVRAVAAGEGAVSKRTAKQLLHHIAERSGTAERANARRLVALLSEKERQVAECVAQGLGNKEIASTLFISEGTVKAHLSNVQAKFQVDNRVLIAVLMTQAV